MFGDNLLPVQEIYGSGGNVVAHLVSVYAEETLYDQRLDIATGRMNVENDFASSPLYCNFMNNGLCGDPKALPGGDIGHSAYPDAAWAARVRVRPTSESYAETGVYEVNQGLYSNANFRSGFKFDNSQDSGVYIPVEVAWEPKLGKDQLAGHYKLGFGYDTSSGYNDFGNTLAAAKVPGFTTQSRTGNTQVWGLVDQMLVRQGSGDDDGLIALAGAVRNDPNNSVYAEQYFAGAVDRGFWKTRPQDAVSLLFTYVSVSGRLSDVQDIEQALGLPFRTMRPGSSRTRCCSRRTTTSMCSAASSSSPTSNTYSIPMRRRTSKTRRSLASGRTSSSETAADFLPRAAQLNPRRDRGPGPCPRARGWSTAVPPAPRSAPRGGGYI